MKLPVLDITNKEVGNIELPNHFSSDIRSDLVKKAVQAINANTRQPYGANVRAGLRQSAELSRRRNTYRGAYGHGISRVPRKILSRRGQQMYWVGAVAPGTVSGRRAHPPKSEKVWSKKINVKERRKAIRSALSATVDKEIVKNRGHVLPDNYPFVIDEKFESIEKTKDVVSAFTNLGFGKELERVSKKKIRAGKGKLRGRKYKKKVGPLLVVSEKCNLQNAARNVAGVNVVLVNKLNAKALAPNANIGRCCIFTKKALDKLAKENLFGDY
ncbi:MAG: 50S ribosomal protein L4 [Nanobdellota archaeon]